MGARMLALEYLLGGASGVETSSTLGAVGRAGPLWIRDQRRLLEDIPPELRGAVAIAEEQEDFDNLHYQTAMTGLL